MGTFKKIALWVGGLLLGFIILTVLVAFVQEPQVIWGAIYALWSQAYGITWG